MSIPLVNVTARIRDQQDRPIAGALVRMKLSTAEKYHGLVVPREATQVTDANGVAVLRAFPNVLGTEGSEYDVHISYPGAGTPPSCGCTQASRPPSYGETTVFRPIRAHAVVPNSDCNLFDILNLPPYEQRGAGEVLPAEVAGYAAEAATAADTARNYAEQANSVKGEVAALVLQAESAKDAAQASESTAERYAKDAQLASDSFCDAVRNFEVTVVSRTEQTAQRLTADATQCIREAQSIALNAIVEQRDNALDETNASTASARTEALNAIAEARENGVHEVNDARDNARDELREMAARYDEDFMNYARQVEGIAKRVCCTAASAANSASKACKCADRAETAAQGLERYRDDALDAAQRAQTAQACANADAQRAEAAADSAQKSAAHAEGSALAAQKAAQAADASAQDANLAAEQAIAAQMAAAQDKAYVESVAGDVEQAVHDVAVELLTPQVITEAVDLATQKAGEYAAAAAQSETNAAKSENTAANAATDATKQARYSAAHAKNAAASAAEAAEYAGKLQDSYTVQMAVANIAGQFYTLSDRVTKLELMHAAGDTEWSWPSSGTGVSLGPEGVKIGEGVTMAPVTIVENGGDAPDNAALTLHVEDYEGVSASS